MPQGMQPHYGARTRHTDRHRETPTHGSLRRWFANHLPHRHASTKQARQH